MLEKRYLDGVEILSVNNRNLGEKLREIAHKIKSEHPEVEEIILFGSFSKNSYTPYSDIDIAIIVSGTRKDFIKRQDDFIDYFSSLPFDVNLVVYTSKEFNDMLKQQNNFVREVREGLSLR